MSISKRKGSPHYWYDFTVGGMRFRGSCETNDAATAKAIEAKLRADAALNKHFKRKPRLTLDQAFAKYWTEHAQFTSSATTTEIHARHMLNFFGKHKYLDELDDAELNRYTAHLKAAAKKHVTETGAIETRRAVANGTINRKLDVLRAVMLRAAKRWGVETSGADVSVHRVEMPEPRTGWISPEQANELIAAAAPHLKGPIRCALLTGLRLGNIVDLTWEQVDLKARIIRVQVKSSKPGRKLHEIPITDQLFALLVEQGPQEKGHVFVRRFKNTVSQGRKIKKPRPPEPVKKFRNSFRQACKRAGITNFRFHDLRHTAATWMRQEGIPIEDIKEVLGHSDIRMTMKYAHHDTATKTRALDALATRRKEAV